jgi:hypothetical protein
MRLGQQILGGVIGGALGAGAWVAIVHFTGYEVGFVAWGVGLLVGLGSMTMAGGRSTALGAVAAGLIALLAVLGGKAGMAYLQVDQIQTQLGLDGKLGKEMAITAIAEDVQGEFTAQGRPVDDQWPKGVLKNDDPRAFYSPQVWAEAESRWHALTPSQQMSMRSRVEHHVNTSPEQLFVAAFLGSFSLYDVLWLVLASMSAFKIASSAGDEGDNTVIQVSPGGRPQGVAARGGGAPTGSPAGPNFLPMRQPDDEPTNVPLSRRSVSVDQVQQQTIPDTPPADVPAPEGREAIEPSPPGLGTHADIPDLTRGSSDDRAAA